MKNLYEVFDEFEQAKTKKDRMNVIQRNLSKTLVEVLQFTFHPAFQWKVKEMPENYKVPDTKPGISISQLSTEIRRIYLFQEGHPEAEKLNPVSKVQASLQENGILLQGTRLT